MAKRKQVDFVITDDGIQGLSPGPGNQSPGAGAARTSAAGKAAAVALQAGQAAERGMTGARRAAKLLLALGPEQAAAVLREMDPAELEGLINEMARVRTISADEKKDILEEFGRELETFDPPVRGGIDQAREFLRKGLGDDQAQEILSRLDRRDLQRDFSFLEQIEPTLLAQALMAEHPQVSAVALSYMNPKTAANILKHLHPERRADIAKRIAVTSRTHPDAVHRVAKVLRDKFEKRNEEIYSDTGGADALANILNHMDRSTEDEILKTLDEKSPDLYRDVRERLYTFEELINLEVREMRMLLSTVNDDYILAAALRGAGEELRRHFFNGLSQNRAADILEEMEVRGPISIREINEARSYVLRIARRLEEEGSVVIKKQREEYI